MKKPLPLLFALFFIVFSLSAAALPVLSAKSEAEEEVETRELPILMYHSISPTQKGVYYIHPQVLEADLIALKGRGYECVTLGEVKAFCRGWGDLPQKPFLLTFDDGHYNNLYYGLDLLKRQNCTAVLHVIGCFSEYSSTHEKDHPEYSHLTWEEIGALASSGVFEIGSHTYKMHDYRPRFGIKRKKSETSEQYEKVLTNDLLQLEEALLTKSGVIPVSFAYPFGAYDKESESIVLSRGYGAVFTCYERVNKVRKGGIEKLDCLWRINRDGTLSTEAFLQKHGL